MSTTIDPYRPPAATVADATCDGLAVLASRWRRLAAGLIDLTLVSVGVLAIALVAAQFGLDLFGPDDGLSIQQSLWVTDIRSQAIWFGAYLLLQGPLLWWRAQTVGKLLVGIRVNGPDGQRASFGRIILRRDVPFALVNFWLAPGTVAWVIDVLLIFRRDRRCLHDLIAGTRVVKAR